MVRVRFITGVHAHVLALALAAINCCQAKHDECAIDDDCLGSNMTSSYCRQGFCTNRFELGCLTEIANELNDDTYKDLIKPRVCNSNDGDDSKCRKVREDIAFGEVRIAAADWDSAVIKSWIYQIILSEVLDVPTTIEFGRLDKDPSAGSFYDQINRFIKADLSYPFEYLKEADRLQQTEKRCDSHSKKPCAHLLPELWDGAIKSLIEGQEEGYLLKARSESSVGRIGFFVPQFTVENDPSLISYFGLRENRTKIAETFKTPTNWGDYCEQVSKDKCNSTDIHATRPPRNDQERQSFFVEDLYTGYFRQLDENNCTKYPKTCTGHFVSPQCSWTTYAEAQMYWQTIPLRSNGAMTPNNGYIQTHMKEIWTAANATKSDVMMLWWVPNLFMEKFAGSHGQFQRIQFPPPTQQCIEYRQYNLGKNGRCSDNNTTRIGEAIGSCDYQISMLQKGISKGLEKMVGYDKNDLFRSPALDFLQDVRLPSFALEKIFFEWNANLHESKSPRDLICRYVYDNLSSFQTYYPLGFPRVFVDDATSTGIVHFSAVAISYFALAWVIITLVFVIKWRAEMPMKLAKIDILLWVIFGEGLVVIGSLVTTIDINDATCMISKWTTILGYSMEIVPIIIKVGTINKLVREARQLQPFDLNTRKLDIIFICAILSVAIYLASASIIDPTKVKTVSVLHPDTLNVYVGAICSSKSIGWDIVDFGLQAVFLIIATVLVFQSRDVFDKFNEGQGLTLMVYSHSVFLIMRIVLKRLAATSLDSAMYQSLASTLKSLDIIFAISFYFGQKFMSNWKSRNSPPLSVPQAQQHSSSESSSRILGNVQVENDENGSEDILLIHPTKHRIRQEGTLRRKKPSKLIDSSLYLPAYSNGNMSVSTLSPLPEIEASLTMGERQMESLPEQDASSRPPSALDPTPEEDL